MVASVKERAEREAFLRFVGLMGERDAWTSVANRSPPEPDLLCIHIVRGVIAFELVAITDPLIAQVNAGFGQSPTGSYYTSDPTERIMRKKLGRAYNTAHPTELLVYNDLLVITPDDAIMETAKRWLEAKDHPFQAAWYMSENYACSLWRQSAA